MVHDHHGYRKEERKIRQAKSLAQAVRGIFCSVVASGRQPLKCVWGQEGQGAGFNIAKIAISTVVGSIICMCKVSVSPQRVPEIPSKHTAPRITCVR